MSSEQRSGSASQIGYRERNPREELDRGIFAFYTGLSIRAYAGPASVRDIDAPKSGYSWVVVAGIRAPISSTHALLFEGEFGSLTDPVRSAMVQDLGLQPQHANPELLPRWQAGGALLLFNWIRLGVSYGGLSVTGSDLSEMDAYRDDLSYVAFTPGIRIQFSSWGVDACWQFINVVDHPVSISEFGGGIFLHL